MSTLRDMSQILFEDRTNETPEQAASRQIMGAALLVANTAFGVAQGHPAVATRVLAAALGIAVARTGAPLDEVIALLKESHAGAKAALDEQLRVSMKNADA